VNIPLDLGLGPFALYARRSREVDEDFGPSAIKAVLAFQSARLGFNSEVGVVGPQPAEALGIDLGRAWLR